ncbi:DUF2242 domain-containing protein [Pseudomonas sp. MWU16-30317]|uniref:DUF2242 domain-containing protein n=1 Tax=Pseudomonas sp. MWU16-30317 TaxID=2878095 RepID=UPI001CFA61B7|nr:DUF2242 domain-containing protein [Pseudomonas sp. MWU16-30317]
MSRFTGFGLPRAAVALAAVLASLAGCSSNKPAIYDHENFDESGTYSRTYPVTDVASCEAARRALLSQGYMITSSDPKLVSGHKSFQQTGDTHMEISFNVVCATDGGHGATMFANALQDRYALKKTNNSASLGVGVLGSVSMPIGSTDDSMVKVASETVTSDKFYDRYFALVENFLPKDAKPKPTVEVKPKDELGVPEQPAEQKPGAQAAPVVPVPAAVPASVAPAPAAAPVLPAAPVSPAASVVAAPVATGAAAVATTEPVATPVQPAAAAAGAPAPTVASTVSSAPAASAPLTSTPVVPVAPAVPAQLQAVDETVQSQPVVPPADLEAPISTQQQASTP